MRTREIRIEKKKSKKQNKKQSHASECGWKTKMRNDKWQ
jgi:hypothetical protein